MVIGWDSPIISETRGTSLVAIMRAQRNDGDVDFEVVNLVDHAVLMRRLHVSSNLKCFRCSTCPVPVRGCHNLKGIDERHHILFALQSREVRLKESGRF